MISIDEVCIDNLDNLIKDNMAFIIKTISGLTGRYVSVENDEELSVALAAFSEAVYKFDENRGAFLGFAKLVIESRIKTHLIKLNKRPKSVSLEMLTDNGIEIEDEHAQRKDDDFIIQLDEYKKQLGYFGLNLEILADTAPKHRDTRNRALKVAETASADDNIVNLTYKKKKLPIKIVAKIANVTEKIVKISKNFILAAMIIFVKRYPALYEWIVKVEG
ncbi:RNA polymerase subunit sigma [Anaerofustis sp.]|uniref:RNA polymerase subunit sigma n=1 Tax=Anaerofustis sp. TaxID=1872517 RepID=UPI0025C106D6|nr:RNA polymerase subunit sigma [Anaerofustis sp.]